ncbi:MAG: FtsQ-type POTRA domain-containing protein [Elusimicrobiota bacterium]|jgi:cell division protein FtsQ|nr:FtsQ-type POTRA domain-containing protein [Elusimicrobiota bacterium]
MKKRITKKKTNYWVKLRTDAVINRGDFQYYPREKKRRQKNTSPNVDVLKTIGKIVRMALIAFAVFLIYNLISKGIDKFFALEIMTIKNIEIIGTQNVSVSEIERIIPFGIGDNIFKVDLSELEDTIMTKNPEVRNISINREIFDGGVSKVSIKIEERVPEAFVKNGNILKGIDSDNKQFPLRGDMKSMKLPLIAYKTDKEAEMILDFLRYSKPALKGFFNNIKEVKIVDAGDIVFIADDGTFVYWGDYVDKNLSKKTDIFQKIYTDAKSKYEMIDYIDMTFFTSGRAIIKPSYKKD